MIILIFLLITILIICFFIGLVKSNIKESNNPLNTNDNIPKKNEVYIDSINGIDYTDNIQYGSFSGIAKITNNSHDKYAIGIYINSSLTGYVPRGNSKLFNILNSYPNEQIICWGIIYYDDYYKKSFGTINIPLGFTNYEITNTENALKIIPEQLELFNKPNKSTEDYFQLLNNDNEIYRLITNQKILKTINYSFNKHMIPQFSRKLELEKDWENLIKLQKYNFIINELSLTFKNATLKRIEKAKQKLS